MGLIEDVLGGSDDAGEVTDESEKQRYAILLNAGPEKTPSAGNAFNYALELDNAGHEVQLFLDGKASRWPGEFGQNPDRPFSTEWERIRERDLLAGACGYCANAFDAADSCKRSGVRLLSDSGEHAPAVAKLANEGYELMTVG